MDFFTYLKRVINEFKSLGKESNLSEAEKAVSDEIKNLNKNAVKNDYVSDSAIEKQAKDELSGWLEGEKAVIGEETKQKADKVDSKRSYDVADYENAVNELSYTLNNAKEAINADSIKKGTARSSIKENRKQEAEKAAEFKENALNSAFDRKTMDYDEQIADLQRKKRTAENELDYRYAAALNDRIKRLTDDRDQKRAADLAKQDGLLGEELYFYVDGLLSKMSPSDALKFMTENKKLKDSLDSYYYFKLYEKYAG